MAAITAAVMLASHMGANLGCIPTFPIQLFADSLGKAMEDDQVVGSLPPTWEMDEAPGPGCCSHLGSNNQQMEALFLLFSL